MGQAQQLRQYVQLLHSNFQMAIACMYVNTFLDTLCVHLKNYFAKSLRKNHFRWKEVHHCDCRLPITQYWKSQFTPTTLDSIDKLLWRQFTLYSLLNDAGGLVVYSIVYSIVGAGGSSCKRNSAAVCSVKHPGLPKTDFLVIMQMWLLNSQSHGLLFLNIRLWKYPQHTRRTTNQTHRNTTQQFPLYSRIHTVRAYTYSTCTLWST